MPERMSVTPPPEIENLRADLHENPEELREHETNARDMIMKRVRERAPITEEEREFLLEDLVRNSHESALGRLSINRQGFKNYQDALRRLDVTDVQVNRSVLDAEGNSALQPQMIERDDNNRWQRLPGWARRMITQAGVSTAAGLVFGSLLAGPVGWGALAGGLAGAGFMEWRRHKAIQQDKGAERSLAYKTAETLFQNVEDARSQAIRLQSETDPNERARIVGEVLAKINSTESATVQRYKKEDRKWRWLRMAGSAIGGILGGGITETVNIAGRINEMAHGQSGMQLDIDGDKVTHWVQHLRDGYHFAPRPEDLDLARHVGGNYPLVTEGMQHIPLQDAGAVSETLFHGGTLPISDVNTTIAETILGETWKAWIVGGLIPTGVAAGQLVGAEISDAGANPHEARRTMGRMMNNRPVFVSPPTPDGPHPPPPPNVPVPEPIPAPDDTTTDTSTGETTAPSLDDFILPEPTPISPETATELQQELDRYINLGLPTFREGIQPDNNRSEYDLDPKRKRAGALCRGILIDKGMSPETVVANGAIRIEDVDQGLEALDSAKTLEERTEALRQLRERLGITAESGSKEQDEGRLIDKPKDLMDRPEDIKNMSEDLIGEQQFDGEEGESNTKQIRSVLGYNTEEKRLKRVEALLNKEKETRKQEGKELTPEEEQTLRQQLERREVEHTLKQKLAGYKQISLEAIPQEGRPGRRTLIGVLRFNGASPEAIRENLKPIDLPDPLKNFARLANLATYANQSVDGKEVPTPLTERLARLEELEAACVGFRLEENGQKPTFEPQKLEGKPVPEDWPEEWKTWDQAGGPPKPDADADKVEPTVDKTEAEKEAELQNGIQELYNAAEPVVDQIKLPTEGFNPRLNNNRLIIGALTLLRFTPEQTQDAIRDYLELSRLANEVNDTDGRPTPLNRRLYALNRLRNWDQPPSKIEDKTAPPPPEKTEEEKKTELETEVNAAYAAAEPLLEQIKLPNNSQRLNVNRLVIGCLAVRGLNPQQILNALDRGMESRPYPAELANFVNNIETPIDGRLTALEKLKNWAEEQSKIEAHEQKPEMGDVIVPESWKIGQKPDETRGRTIWLEGSYHGFDIKITNQFSDGTPVNHENKNNRLDTLLVLEKVQRDNQEQRFSIENIYGKTLYVWPTREQVTQKEEPKPEPTKPPVEPAADEGTPPEGGTPPPDEQKDKPKPPEETPPINPPIIEEKPAQPSQPISLPPREPIQERVFKPEAPRREVREFPGGFEVKDPTYEIAYEPGEGLKYIGEQLEYKGTLELDRGARWEEQRDYAKLEKIKGKGNRDEGEFDWEGERKFANQFQIILTIRDGRRIIHIIDRTKQEEALAQRAEREVTANQESSSSPVEVPATPSQDGETHSTGETLPTIEHASTANEDEVKPNLEIGETVNWDQLSDINVEGNTVHTLLTQADKTYEVTFGPRTKHQHDDKGLIQIIDTNIKEGKPWSEIATILNQMGYGLEVKKLTKDQEGNWVIRTGLTEVQKSEEVNDNIEIPREDTNITKTEEKQEPVPNPELAQKPNIEVGQELNWDNLYGLNISDNKLQADLRPPDQFGLNYNVNLVTDPNNQEAMGVLDTLRQQELDPANAGKHAEAVRNSGFKLKVMEIKQTPDNEWSIETELVKE